MEDRPSRSLALNRNHWIGIGIFLIAFLFRLIGIRWGLPNSLHFQSYHPDEFPIYSFADRLDPVHGKITPGVYNYGSLFLVVLRFFKDFVATYTGMPDPKNAQSLFDFIGRVNLAGRFLVAFCGAGMASVVWAIMRRWTSSFGAMMGALLVAVAPAALVHSRFQTTDIPATFLLAVSSFYALKLLPAAGEEDAADKDRMKWALLSGLFAGLSAGTKYTGILGVLTVLVALGIHKRPRMAIEMGGAIVASVVTFLATTPGILLDNAAFMKDFMFEMAHTHTGHGIEFMSTATGYAYHLANLFVGIGAVATAVGLAGLAGGAIKKHPWVWALLAFAIPYYILIGGSEVKFLRYTFPLYIAVPCGFAWLIGAAHAKKGPWLLVSVLGLLGLLGADGGGLRYAALYTQGMTDEEPRDAAARYLFEIGKGKTVGLVKDPWYYTPPLYPFTAQMRTAPGNYDRHLSLTHDPHVVRFVDGPDRRDWDVRLVDVTKPDYVVFSNFEETHAIRFQKSVGELDGSAKLERDRYTEFMAELTRNYKLDRAFGVSLGDLPPDMLYVRPVIQVWKRNDQP